MKNINYYVPVVDINNNPLMPTCISRAFKWIKSKRATPFYKKGLFCIRLNELVQQNKQEIVVGIDPGSKKEGFTVKSKVNTFLNIQADTVDWVKDNVKTRREMRRKRRYRKTPCRKPRWNRKVGKRIPPSTKSRWQWKLRIVNWLIKVFPVTDFVVEDVKAKTTGKRRWDKTFSQLEVGKSWFYSELEKLGKVQTKLGYETKELRDELGLKKSSNKLSKDFSAHCVDSWVLANSVFGGKVLPDNKKMLYIKPLKFYRRQLHVLKPSVGGKRKRLGGTMSLGLKRGSFIKHDKYGICYVGGTSNGCISVHSCVDNKRLARNIKVEDCKFVCYNYWLLF
jgi:hypothetical protein